MQRHEVLHDANPLIKCCFSVPSYLRSLSYACNGSCYWNRRRRKAARARCAILTPGVRVRGFPLFSGCYVTVWRDLSKSILPALFLFLSQRRCQHLRTPWSCTPVWGGGRRHQCGSQSEMEAVTIGGCGNENPWWYPVLLTDALCSREEAIADKRMFFCFYRSGQALHGNLHHNRSDIDAAFW